MRMQVKSDLWSVKWQENPIILYSKLHIPNTYIKSLNLRTWSNSENFANAKQPITKSFAGWCSNDSTSYVMLLTENRPSLRQSKEAYPATI